MEGVAPPHYSACSFRKTLERTKINAKSLYKHLTSSRGSCIMVPEDEKRFPINSIITNERIL